MLVTSTSPLVYPRCGSMQVSLTPGVRSSAFCPDGTMGFGDAWSIELQSTARSTTMDGAKTAGVFSCGGD